MSDLTKPQRELLGEFAPAPELGLPLPDRYITPRARRMAKALCGHGLLREGGGHWFQLTEAGRDALGGSAGCVAPLSAERESVKRRPSTRDGEVSGPADSGNQGTGS